MTRDRSRHLVDLEEAQHRRPTLISTLPRARNNRLRLGVNPRRRCGKRHDDDRPPSWNRDDGERSGRGVFEIAGAQRSATSPSQSPDAENA